MASTFTPNIQLEEPARGDQVGTWDTPINANMTLVDSVAGAITTISLNNSPVVLAAAQFQAKGITFNSTLTGSVTITFPTSFKKSYEIQNLCTGSSAFVITLATTAAAGQKICCPPGETIDCFNDGSNIKFKSLDRVGAYWDYAGSSVPAWVSGCTIPPYLNCDGSAIPAAYTVLPIILGSSLLPDSKGRSRFALDQGAGRLSSAIAGFSPNTVGSAGGSQSLQTHSHAITDPGHVHGIADATLFANAGAGSFRPAASSAAVVSASAVTGITINNAGAGNSQNMPPAYIGGLTLIRSA